MIGSRHADSIEELRGLEALEILAEDYKLKYGALPFNLSHWDPSIEVSRFLSKYLKLPALPSPMHYIYSYYTGVHDKVAEKLGFEWKNHTCLLLHSGTSAIVLATWWAKAMGFEKLLIVCPTYFPVIYLAQVMTMPFQLLFAQREAGNWALPQEALSECIRGVKKTVVWITNPIYCTGVYLSREDRQFLASLLDAGVAIVADECLSKSGYEISRELGEKENFVGLYTPHKSVCLNAIKFGAVVFNRKDEEFFDSWADVFTGGLSASNHSGIFHFLDKRNFYKFDMEFSNLIEDERKRVIEIIKSYKGSFEIDENCIGHFMTCYFPALPAQEADDDDFVRDFVNETATLLISGVKNHFNPDWGFCFRINLARRSRQFYASLHRTLDYLAALA